MRMGLGPNPQLPEVLGFCSQRLWEGKLKHGGAGLRAGIPRTDRERLLRLRVGLPLGAGAPRRGRVHRLRASHAPWATRTRPQPRDRHGRSRSLPTATQLPVPATPDLTPRPPPRRPLPAPRAPRRPHSAMRPSRMRPPPRIAVPPAAGTRRAPAGHGAPPPELERSRGWSRGVVPGVGMGPEAEPEPGGAGPGSAGAVPSSLERHPFISRAAIPHPACSHPSPHGRFLLTGIPLLQGCSPQPRAPADPPGHGCAEQPGPPGRPAGLHPKNAQPTP